MVNVALLVIETFQLERSNVAPSRVAISVLGVGCAILLTLDNLRKSLISASEWSTLIAIVVDV